MILETIFLWVGGLLCISVAFFGIVFLWLSYFNRFWYNVRISIKAIFYDLLSNQIESRNKNKDNSYINAMKMQEGTSWYINYKGKRYDWKCIKVEEIKK